MTTASAQVASRPRALIVTGVSVADAWPLIVPCGFLIVGALIGYAFSLDQRVALERLLGLIAASLLAIGASIGLRRVEQPAGLLIGTALAALLASMWVIAASGPDVFRGTLGERLDVVFRPVFGLVSVTDPVEITNTRFIVGYNGVIDLALVMIFASGAVLLERPRAALAIPSGALLVLGLVLLVGAGARGGLTGLAAGICTIGLLVWPRRYALLAVLAAPAVLALAAISILDKGLEFSSTAGRLTYWGDLARLLVEYPLTGVGLGVNTANAIALQYEINPDPERIFYAHNTFVQSYLEQGPLGMLGMLIVPGVVIGAALLARRSGVPRGRRALFVAGLGIVGGLEAHGLTDQVVTTNVGTALLLLGAAAIVASLPPAALAALNRWTSRVCGALLAVVALGVVALVALPAGRAQLLLDAGGLKMDQALAQPTQSASRGAELADAETLLSAALEQDATQPAVLRDLAWVRSARFDDDGGLRSLALAAGSPRIDTFDMLQIAHVYRDLGVADEAYAWAVRAYGMWGRSLEDAVMENYAQSTLTDTRARTLATQAEAAMRARSYADANSLFQQALTFEPKSTYLQDRIGASQRAVDKYGPQA
ncbi:MAG: O-antigen ligase family protein [Chloroflexi bacterium]|nr:O-antigen ligase family protein [Chloroflexota bacterium]